MKRQHFDDRKDQATADEFLAGHAVCRTCGYGCERETLSSLGGLCRDCFAAYCNAGKRSVGAVRGNLPQRLKGLLLTPKHPRAWAHRLKAREEAGESLSPVAREAWRIALRDPVPQEVEA